jgi:hypothetical protein
VRLNPLSTSTIVWSIVGAPGVEQSENDWQEKLKYLDKKFPRATLSTTNPTWSNLGSNPEQSRRLTA